MDHDDNSNLFEGIPSNFGESHSGPVAGTAGEPSGVTVYQRDELAALDAPALLSHILTLQDAYIQLESDNRFLSWEFREYQNNLTYFARATKLAHKLNASNLNTIASVATNEIPEYFRCGFAALFLYNIEERCFELCRSTLSVEDDFLEVGRDAFLVRLFIGHGDPFIAEYPGYGTGIELDNGEHIDVEVPDAWFRVLGSKALIFPLRVKQQNDSMDPLTLGGLVIGGCRDELVAKDAEGAILFSDLLSSSLYNAQLLQKLNDMTIIDPLTQIYNRRHLMNQLGNAVIQARRHGNDLSIAMIDIDRFKRFNDMYGHICGDEVLRAVAAALKSDIRIGIDVPARYGGEEFMLLLPFTGLDAAVDVADRIRRNIKALTVHFEGHDLSVTCSFGVAQYESGESLERFIERADVSLYQAKHNGRDQVCASSSSRG